MNYLLDPEIIAERLESLKAGILAGCAVVVAFGFTAMANIWLSVHWSIWASLIVDRPDFPWFFSGAMAGMSGFLFGVTYRYIIRTDENPHLKSGGVLAFGLVRGLAQVDTAFKNWGEFLPLLVLGGESVFLFAIAAFILDVAMAKQWLKRFS